MKIRLLQLLAILLTFYAAHAQELCVMTYNVRYSNSSDTNAGNGWATRKAYLMNLVNFQQPDLVGVQEATKGQMTDLDAGLKGYGRIGVGRNDGQSSGEHSAIFYKKERLRLVDHGDFWLSDTPEKPSKGFPSKGGSTTYYRICTWGKFIDKATGSYLYHFNTHMDLDETNRQQSYYLIKKKIIEIAGAINVPVIISGDYNAVQTGDAYKLFYNSGFLYDCFQRTKQKFMTNGTCPGFNANNYSTVSGELRRIDHIFVTRNFDVNHYGVLNPCYYSTSGTAEYYERAYSDHSPVIAKLSIRTPEMADLDNVVPPIENGVYQISTARELKAFASIVNGMSVQDQNTAAKAVLLNDIDMAEITDWNPIGTSGTPFTGTFNGQDYAIQNLVIDTKKSYSGLFGSTLGATIRNFSISGTLTVADGTCEHGIIGYASSSTIRDINSALNITIAQANEETKHVGGVAGSLFNSSTVTRCSFNGTLSDAGSNTVGGIVGYADQTANNISYCINYGTVQSEGEKTNTGGILGYVNFNGFKTSFCANVGKVSGNEEYAGQIIGRQIKAMSTPPSKIYYVDAKELTAFGTGTETSVTEYATAVSEDNVASGELTTLLNTGKSVANHVFYQNLNEGEQSDPYPILGGYPEHKVVYQGTFGKKKDTTDTANYNFYVNDGGCLTNLALINGFTTSVAFIANHVSYSFEPTNSWGTIYLPFAAKSNSEVQFYEIVPDQTSNSVLSIVPCTSLEAYTPGLYLLTGNTFNVEADNAAIGVPPTKTSITCGDYTFTGTFSQKTSNNGGYVLSGSSFQYTEGDVVTNAFEAALTTASGGQHEITFLIFDADGINSLTPTLSKDEGSIYNLSGQRISKMQRGIYIKNGRKIISE